MRSAWLVAKDWTALALLAGAAVLGIAAAKLLDRRPRAVYVPRL